MRFLPTAILAGAAALAVATATLPAGAQPPQPRLVTLMLPGGQLVQVQYVSEATPQAAPQPTPLFAAMPQPDPVFAVMQRMSAMMQRQADAMLRQAVQFSAPPTMQMLPANLQAGGQFYSVSTSFSSIGGCTHSTEISYAGNGLKPRMVSSTSGNCGQTQPAPMYQLGPNQGGAKLVTASTDDAYKHMIKPAVLMSR